MYLEGLRCSTLFQLFHTYVLALRNLKLHLLFTFQETRLTLDCPFFELGRVFLLWDLFYLLPTKSNVNSTPLLEARVQI